MATTSDSMKSYISNIKLKSDELVKSQEDKRLYRALELTNGLKILLISDPETDKAAAALDVNVGSMSDPDDLLGLAHFLEHMLFMGTEKYPSENEYNKYISDYGGSCNASTVSDHTTYYFDIVPDYLPGALDRFSQFFLCPLFTESATDRELNAVNAEHEKNVPNDSWRLDQLEKYTSKKSHPYNKFQTGNRVTLETIPKEKGLNVREELLKFHQKWYSSNIMTLAVLGKNSIEELEEIVVPLFSSVVNKNCTGPEWLEHPFGEEQLQMKGYVIPVKDFRNLNITFPIPDLHKYYKSGPGHYLSHLLGHEGPGSLLSALKARGWCNNLVGGSRTGAKGFWFFGINVDLTEEGMDHIDDIITLVFQYINMLKETGPKEWIYEEYQQILKTHFRFKDKESPQSCVNNVVHNLQEYPIDEILIGPYLMTDWRPDLIEMVLNYLTPSNVRVAVIGRQFESIVDEVEPWYGTKYKLEKIPEATIQKWRDCGLTDELKLPNVNEFITTDFNILTLEDKNAQKPTFPTVVKDSSLIRVWFKQDDEFFLPKATLTFEFVSPLAYLDPLNCNMTYLFVQLLKDSLNEYVYAAELAGLKWDISNTKYGLLLSIGGYNSKQHILLDKIVEKMTTFKIDPKRFAILKENYIRSLKNFEAEQPYQQAIYYIAVLLTEQAWTKEELIKATEDLTVEKVQDFIPQLLSRTHIECLLYGNSNKATALKHVEILEKRLESSVSL